MMMMTDCFCGMVDPRKAFSLISSWNHSQRSWPWRISDTLRAEFEPVQNLSSGLVEWSCAVVITTTPRAMSVLSMSVLCMNLGMRAKNWQIPFLQFLAKAQDKQTNKTKQRKAGKFSHFLKTFSIKFSKTKISIAVNISMQIPHLAKFWFLNYWPRCSSSVNEHFDNFFFFFLVHNLSLKKYLFVILD